MDADRFGWMALPAVVLFAAWTRAGYLRLSAPENDHTSVRLRIVQGNVAQAEKWRPEMREAIFSRYLDLSAASGAFDVVLWPETTFPGYLDENPDAVARIVELLSGTQHLLTGVPDKARRGADTLYFNAIQVYGQQGGPAASYAKHRLYRSASTCRTCYW